MAEPWNNGQPNQQAPQPPYPYPQQQQQQPQQGYQGPPQQHYQNPYPQQPAQQPQHHGAPPPQCGAPQQRYPQVPPQQYPGQPYPGQQQYGQQQYGQPYPGPGQPQGMDPNQPAPKPKKKRSRWATFFIVLFSPFIALAFVAYALYWVLAWLLTPVGLLFHFVLCGLGLIWYSGVKLLASGRSQNRLLQPVYPQCPRFWTGKYWVQMNRDVRSVVEGLAGILEFFSW